MDIECARHPYTISIKPDMSNLFEKIEDYLKKTFSDRVGFEDGSYVEYFNREAILYVDKNNHQMEIIWWLDPTRAKQWTIARENLDRWDPPFEEETIGEAKKKEIERKVIEYCRIQGIRLNISG
jgi:hypothetical protein